MSGKIAGGVWDLDLPRNKAFVLLAMADHADHIGGNVYPSFGLIAWKTGYSYRQVLRIVKDLEVDGILILERAGKDSGKPNRYRVNLAAGKQKEPYNAKTEAHQEGYDIIVSHPSDGVTNDIKQGGYDTIVSDLGVTSSCHTGCDIQESHEPSIKPSIKPSEPLQKDVEVQSAGTDQKPVQPHIAVIDAYWSGLPGGKPTGDDYPRYVKLAKQILSDGFNADDLARCMVMIYDPKASDKYWHGKIIPLEQVARRLKILLRVQDQKAESSQDTTLTADQMTALRREMMTMPNSLRDKAAES